MFIDDPILGSPLLWERAARRAGEVELMGGAMNDGRDMDDRLLQLREREEKPAAPEPAWLQGRREYQWFHENRTRIEEMRKVLQ